MNSASSLSKPSPLMNIAAVAVIVASLAAVAAVTGIIPAAHSQPEAAAVQPAKAANAEGARGAAQSQPPQRGAPSCAQCGVVESVRAVQAAGQASGLGAVAGGVAGAVVGSQFGKGDGRTALGVLGAAGGAYAGHEIEKNMNKSTSWRVTVRMDDGTARTLSQPTQPAFAVGEKVKLINGALVARG